MKKSLGCLSANGLLSSVFTLLIVGGLYLFRGGLMFNPGPLSASTNGNQTNGVRSHAETEGRCSACHAPFWGLETMADRCLGCHSGIKTELADPESFHGALLNGNPDKNCRQCHTDHMGADANLTSLDSVEFPHAITGYSLNAHVQRPDGTLFVCKDCHLDRFKDFDPEDCAICHRSLDEFFISEHLATFGRDCRSCHDGIDTYGASFDHNLTDYALIGQHELLDCGGCHAGAVTIAMLQATSMDCYDCHAPQDNHNGEFGKNCGVCHDPVGWEQATFNHNLTEFILLGRHTAVQCLDCHQDELFDGTPQECVGCHAADDAHNGQLGLDCARCHIPDDWQRTIFNHNQTDFPLTGEHARIECIECHEDASFQGIPQDCAACHADDDIHEGQLGQDCARCHTPSDWKESIFDHSETGFQLTGSHDRIACTQCHTDGEFEGTPQQCVACHAEPAYHLRLFEINCENCHTTEAWVPAQFGLPHTFPISHGRQGPSSCKTCHPNSLTAYTCYGCHEHNPGEIAEEHRDEGISNFQDCTRCHPTGREEEGGGD